MSKLLQLRGGTTSEHSSFTGAVREVTVDTTKDTLVVHDGATAGGFPLLKEGDVTNANFTGADLEIGKGGTGASTAGAARTALGLAIGTDVLAPNGSGANLTNLPAGGATSINGLSDGTNDGSSVGLGTNALANDDGTTNRSTAVGTSALTTNTSGFDNTATGYESLKLNTTGAKNTANGAYALANSTTGMRNTAIGHKSLYQNTTGHSNTASGYQSLFSNTTGINNTASGMYALRLNTTAASNTAIGHESLKANTTGANNVAVGASALVLNTTGYANTGVGRQALGSNTTGLFNTATGFYALKANTTGGKNTTSGAYALTNTTTGVDNTASGYNALKANTTGGTNTATGAHALKVNTTGGTNTATGYMALTNNTTGNYNVASGYQALYSNTTASKNTAQGYQSLYSNTTGANNTASGFYSVSSSATAENEFTLGDAATNNLRCNDTSISSLSDRRDKTNITNLPDSAGLDIINALRPVTFNWDRREWYDNNTPDGSKVMPDWRRWKANSGLKYGFIAQEVQATIAGEKCMADSMIVTDGNLDRLEFAPQHLLTNAIKAIQQLSEENEALKIRLTALENA